MKLSQIRVVAWIFALCALWPAAAHAQSTLTGVVKDASGAVLPGVTVEASSPALIEKTRSVTTDETGGYRLVDLRPGNYVLTFTLQGFAPLERQGLELPSNFTMTVNAEMKVGSLEETLTVTGASPIVDVQSTTKSQVLTRESLDAIPTGRTIQGMGQLVTGVSLNQPDIGGSKAMQQTYMSAHGAGSSQTTVQVDGLLVNGIDVDGAVQSYFNSSMSQEMVYTTSGASADVSGGGVRLNMVPRDGGNTISGNVFLGFQNQSFQSNNVGTDLINRGLKTSDGIEKLYNIEGAVGGPIKKDTVWFFASARNFVLNTLPANTFYGTAGTETPTSAALPSAEQGVDPQSIRSVQARVTWQLSPKNKFAFYNDRLLKNRGSAMTAGFDPKEAGIVWTSPIYTTGSVKFSSTATNKIYIEAGASTNYERYNTLYQSGLAQTPFSPAWYTTINKNDTALGTQWGTGATNQGMYPDRFAAMGAVSYVTGTHNIKVGMQDTWGRYVQFRSANGDLRANFLNGKASTATILNTPVNFQDNLKADLGIYGQDSWTLNRLTINYGARWEYFASGVPQESSGVGRFVTSVRNVAPIDMPSWTSIAPRGGVVYDLFGNQKTALKFSIGRYEQAGTTGFSNRYNPLALQTVNVAWTDLNNDGVPQGAIGCVYLQPGCEMNLAGQLPKNFGLASLPTFDPDIKRMYNIETTLSVQHEIMSGVSVTAGWYNRQYHNMWRRTNTGVGFSDFTPFTVFSPIDGSPITYYNVSAAKASQITTNLVDTNAPDRTDKYNGFEYNFNMRLPHHITLFGGGMSERMLSNSCDDNWNPNLLLYCDQSKNGLPFRTQFKIAGSVPLSYGITVSVAFQSLPGYLYGTSSVGALTGVSGPSGAPTAAQLLAPNGASTVLLVTSSSVYTTCPGNSAAAGCVVGAKIDPGLTVASLSIPLVAPMTEYGDRINQLDINVIKSFKFDKVTIQPKLDIFNVLNRAPVTAVLGLNYGTAAYNQPSVVLNPRTIQLGAILRF
ncbi:MAG TPA: carboxypeptidase regulatory-like domain-containing protein [Vicinamibacterales bacterium]